LWESSILIHFAGLCSDPSSVPCQSCQSVGMNPIILSIEKEGTDLSLAGSWHCDVSGLCWYRMSAASAWLNPLNPLRTALILGLNNP
jgi:hypothetical protein